MSLLHSSTLAPNGPHNLAAVRFSSAVRVNKIRISNADAVVLDVFLNCQQVPSPHEPKPKATNALVPTRIVHPGDDPRDYYVNMSPNYTTKLMIVKGDFHSLQLAVYGTVYTPSTPPTSYAPRVHTAPSTSKLPLALDPARADDPLALGTSLLHMTSEPPGLALVAKFALCHDLHEELNGPDAPQLYTDMKECLESLDLGFDWIRNAAETTRRPISEQVADDALKGFAERVQDSLYDKDEDQAQVLSQLLYNTACQSSPVAELFTSMWDAATFAEIFATAPSKALLKNLYMAAASRDVARFLRTGLDETFFKSVDKDQALAGLIFDLNARIEGWELFTDDMNPDPTVLVAWVDHMISHEASLGIFLLCIFSTPSLIDTFTNLPSTPIAALGFEDLHTLGRAFLGVGGVLAALAWADAADESGPGGHTLAVLRLLLANDEYGALTRKTLMVPRLFGMVDALIRSDDDLSRTRMDAEAVILALLAHKDSALHPHVWNRAVESDAPPLFGLHGREREIERVADLVYDGLPAALRVVVDAKVGEDERTLLLFALEIVKDAVRQDGVHDVRRTAWKEDLHGLEFALVEIVESSARALVSLTSSFDALSTTSPSTAALALLDTAASALDILPDLLGLDSLPAHATRVLVRALISLVSSTRTLQSMYAKLRNAAHETMGAAYTLVGLFSHAPGAGKSVIRALAESTVPESALDDPVSRMQAVADLLDAFLPDGGDDDNDGGWIRDVVVPVLPELRELVGVLAPERKASVLLRLIDLDRDGVCVADWLVGEELRVLERAAALLDADEHHHDDAWEVDPRMVLVRAQVGLAFDWIARLAEGGAMVQWDEAALARSMVVLVDADLVRTDGPVVRAARALQPTTFELQLATSLVLLGDGEQGLRRAAQLLAADSEGEPDPPLLAKLSLRAGCALYGLVQPGGGDGIQLDEETASAVRSLLKWMLERHNDFEPFVLLGISEQDFTALGTAFEDLHSQMRFSTDSVTASVGPDLLAPVRLAPSQLSAALSGSPGTTVAPRAPTPSTPPRASRNTAAALLEFATVSPPASLLRSPQVTGLTKTYQKNDFRQLRSVPAGRINTSRLPSLHVDDFENASQSSAPSPTIPSPQHSIAQAPPPGLQFGGHLPFYSGSQPQF
ncbi:hypothetical protein EXIGLDRAFT_835113 [Exidia glandulosa HHB12029]|uniref:Virilizer N-terminal domain-containing protein n=1 Tax=Exidia glandulosa HHB12029 TaxID=1314781 RepID=A0A165J2I1_EXIGL|nr:hypothetical protein EXIGLDRAFT_835113 [Exidia glandulosa HHB12029]